MTVVSPGTRDTVYLDQAASIEIITEALKAWGLRVRSEREMAQSDAVSPPPPTPVEANWQTTRPTNKAPGRLENELSPIWLPIRGEPTGNDPISFFGWFTRAA